MENSGYPSTVQGMIGAMRLATAKLSGRQQRFVDEFLIDLNATQAAIRAGYSEKTARSIAAENLTKPDISAEIEMRVKALCERYSVTHRNVLSELAAIAFSDITDVVEIGRHGVRVSPTDSWSEPARRAVQEVHETRHSIKVKLASKLQALELLGRYLTLWRQERPQQIVGFTINVNDAAPVVRLADGNGDR